MNKPEVKIIEIQSEEIKDVNISNYERDMLLNKYGYSNSNSVEYSDSTNNSNDLSFEDMCRQEDERIRREKYQQSINNNRPKPITFDGNYQSENIYKDDVESGLSYKITIVTNIK